MSAAEWPKPAEFPAAPRAKGSRSRRSRRETRADVPAPAGLADFVAMEVHAIDAEKWLVSPVLWWQPELALPLPETSGLRSERRHKAPMPGFLNLEVEPLCPAGKVAGPEAVLRPRMAAEAPASDLMPLGWDPRSVLGKGIAE